MRCCVKYCGATVLVSTGFCCRPLTASVRAWLETVEAVPRVSRTTNGELILCFTPPIAKCISSVHQCSARVLSTAVFFSHLSAAQQWTSASVKKCTTRGVALHSSVYTLPFFGAGQPLDWTTVADQLGVFIVCTRDTSWFFLLVEEIARRINSDIVRITVIH